MTSETTCPVCGKSAKRISTHLLQTRDSAHTAFVEQQFTRVDAFFDTLAPCSSEALLAHGILLGVNQVKAHWQSTRTPTDLADRVKRVTGAAVSAAKRGKPWTPACRKAREQANARGAYAEPWNKGLTVQDPRVRANQDKRNAATSKSLRKLYTTGDMHAWTTGLTKETDHRVAKIAKMNSKRMTGHATGHARGTAGVRKDLGFYCASAWEANVFRVLLHLGGVDGVDFLRDDRNVFPLVLPNGKRWLYHVDLLDVSDLLGHGRNVYYEIKGYADARSIEAINLFKTQYPTSKLLTITVKNKHGLPVDVDYLNLEKQYAADIPLWETKTHNLLTHPELYEVRPVVHDDMKKSPVG